MKIEIIYLPQLISIHSGAAVSQETLLKFEQLTKFPLSRTPTKLLPVAREIVSLIEDSERHVAFVELLKKLGLQMSVARRETIWETHDLENAELLVMWYPFVAGRVHKDQHPGTLMYRGIGHPKFIGWEYIVGTYFAEGINPGMEYPAVSNCSEITINKAPLRPFDIAESDKRLSLFCSDRVKNSLDGLGVNDLCYWKTKDYRNRDEQFGNYWGISVLREIQNYRASYGIVGKPVFAVSRDELNDITHFAIINTDVGECGHAILVKSDVFQTLRDCNRVFWAPVQLE